MPQPHIHIAHRRRTFKWKFIYENVFLIFHKYTTLNYEYNDADDEGRRITHFDILNRNYRKF